MKIFLVPIIFLLAAGGCEPFQPFQHSSILKAEPQGPTRSLKQRIDCLETSAGFLNEPPKSREVFIAAIAEATAQCRLSKDAVKKYTAQIIAKYGDTL